MTATRAKACRVCGTSFTPLRPMQKVCSPPCALKLAEQSRQKAEAKKQAEDKRETRKKLDALKRKPQLVKEAQQAFNAFIRARDLGKPCISCGVPLTSEPNSYDAGHYRSVGSAPHLRFDETNVHGQCKHCNRHLAGNHVAYRLGLIERIGPQALELLERDQTPRRYTKEGLIELTKHYRAAKRRTEQQK